ncbi:MAG: hypothetical protein EOO43_08595 [Flavobacterium sp.]|nr:MAG: hypothetical protein EOO43_08595 [Flavobacterium sp.]
MPRLALWLREVFVPLLGDVLSSCNSNSRTAPMPSVSGNANSNTLIMEGQTENIFEGVEALIFCDESKFYINNSDPEDAIYYFGITVKRDQVKPIHEQFKALLEKHRVQTSTFHSTTIFKETRPRKPLMSEIADIIISNKLHCFCFKYDKSKLFEPTRNLKHHNNEIFDFEDMEFQALFYFLLYLNTYLRDSNSSLFHDKVIAYFDRNVYGKKEIEAFKAPHEEFVVKRMTFSEKSLISLLALPDFFGYIFRKAKLSLNKSQSGNMELETSPLVLNSYSMLLKITEAKLFHFLEVDTSILGQALKINFE